MDIMKFSGEYEFLSNFYWKAPLRYVYNYTCSEAAFQGQKPTTFDERYNFIRYGPGMAKKMGHKIKQIRADWDDVKVDFMRDIVFAKFMQNPDVAAKLIATGDMELVEGNHWHDTFWGVDCKTGEGLNLLGKILMEVRDCLRNDSLDAAVISDEEVYFTRFTVPELTRYDWKNFQTGERFTLEFAQKFEIEHKNFDSGISDCQYRVRDRNFVDLSFRTGELVEKIYERSGNEQEIRQYADGTKFFYQCEDIPVFDSGDGLWDSVDELAIFRDAQGINMIRSRHGWAIPKIIIYVGLKNNFPLEKISAIIGGGNSTD